MENPNQHIQDLIVELFCGEIDEYSLVELRNWASASSENQQYLQNEQEVWFSSVTKKSLSHYDSQSAFELFLRRVAAEKATESDVTNSSHEMSITFPRWARYAAAIVLLFAAIGFAFKQGQKNTTSQLTDIIIEAPQGSQTRTTLPDGTVVWLNAGSRLTYPQAYGLKDRNVTLTGEACFKVHHNNELPFSVNTQAVCVEDIGTLFNLRDYPKDNEAEIVLQEGAIKLENKLDKTSETTIMSPGQRVVIDKQTGKQRMNNADASTATQWTSRHLILKGENIAGIAQKLERYYGVKVIVDSKSQNKGLFYGEFSRREDSINDVLTALSSTHKLKYRRQGDTIVIY